MTETLLVSLISSSVAVAIVSAIKELIIWKLNRKAKLTDDETIREASATEAEKKIKKRLDEQRSDINKLLEAMNTFQQTLEAYLKSEKILLRDKIRYLIYKYVEYGEITIDEKNAIKHMWHIYHYEWGGNGDLDDAMSLLETIKLKLPIHQTEEVS